MIGDCGFGIAHNGGSKDGWGEVTLMDVCHCLESDTFASGQDDPRFQAVPIGRERCLPALALLDVVVGSVQWTTFLHVKQWHTTAASQSVREQPEKRFGAGNTKDWDEYHVY